MSGFPILSKDELDADQRAFWDELTLGPRGFYTGGADAKRLPDLYNAWMQFPEFGQLMLRLGDEIRSKSELTGKLREILVLTTSALLGAQVEFDFHVPFAQNEGLSDAVILAIRDGEVPVFEDELDRAVYESNVELIRTATISKQNQDAIINGIGYKGLMQLIAVVTLYVVTAYTTNVARVKLADDFSADPEKLKNFFAGKPLD